MPSLKLTLGGKRWAFERPRSITLDGVECDGLCDADGRTIKVKKSLTGLEELDATLHEAAHAVGDFLDEEYVERAATELAKALWILGYRRLSPAEAKALEQLRDG